ncbi:MAG: transcriptional regulator NrdR [Actinobacteria bacterium]|nr:transcriptional regulator NrdR [Actinomycetota bacterium]
MVANVDPEDRSVEAGGSSGSFESIVVGMRCPSCSADDDKVVDSRSAEDGSAIRRRRQCLACGERFTTFERAEDVLLTVIKRSGEIEPFDAGKLIAGLRSACKNRPVGEDDFMRIARGVEEEIRQELSPPTTQTVGIAVLEQLRALDEISYLRFASVYKGFEDVDDFQREVGLLTKKITKKTEAKHSK